MKTFSAVTKDLKKGLNNEDFFHCDVTNLYKNVLHVS
jgi:hypothetical protein